MENIEFNFFLFCFFNPVVWNLDKMKSKLFYTVQVLLKYAEHEGLLSIKYQYLRQQTENISRNSTNLKMHKVIERKRKFCRDTA